jgi:hypothetical protein
MAAQRKQDIDDEDLITRYGEQITELNNQFKRDKATMGAEAMQLELLSKLTE